MHYVTVFEVTQKPFEWWGSAIGLIFVVIGVVFIKFGPRLERNKNAGWLGPIFASTFAIPSRLLGWFFVIFASFWTLVAFSSTYSTYREYVQAYKNGQYSVVEGLVEDFHPMPYEGHQRECFRVNLERFCYSDYEVSPAFNQSASLGGPIRAGQPVRIAYYEGDDSILHILRLEIAADSLPSEASRAARAKMEEEEWSQRGNDNPTMDRIGLGFSFAVLLISLCWNLDWQHYIRYWIRRGPPYPLLVELGFRLFSLACLVGSGINLVRTIAEKHRTFIDFEKAALFSLILIGPFGAFDLIRRRRLRAANQSASSLSHSPPNS